MDSNFLEPLLSGGISSIIVASFYFTYKICKRSRCKSSCCGFKSELNVSLDGQNSLDSQNSTDGKVKPFIV